MTTANTKVPVLSALEVLKAAGLNINDGRTLIALTAGPMTLNTISTHLGLSKTSGAFIADKLERHVLAVRTTHVDRRKCTLRLTPAGRVLAETLIHS